MIHAPTLHRMHIHVADIFSIGLYAVGLIFAWSLGVDAGTIASAITIVSIPLIAAIVFAIKHIGSAIRENRAAWDKQYESSLGGQMDAMRLRMEQIESKAKVERDELLRRVNDANKKLHDERNQWNRDNLLRQHQTNSLLEELRLAKQELHETRAELRSYKTELEKAHAENLRLMAQLQLTSVDVRRLQDSTDALKTPDPDQGQVM